jgi:hypothetical protein
MRQEWHYKVARLEKVYRLAKAFSAVYVHANRRRDERWAESDECHVDAPTYGNSSKQGKHISQ